METPRTPSGFDWDTFTQALDTVRESRGLSWKEVAAQSGVSATTLSRITRGKTCDVDAIAALRVWMNVPIDKFFVGTR
jgi:transcriptional regulator with XRE-family HTH domain